RPESHLAALHRRARDPRGHRPRAPTGREGPARAARGPGRLAQRGGHGRRRRDSVLAAEALMIAHVTEDDLPDLLPLMRGYCDFYGVAPSDEDLLALSRALLASPDCHGVQLIARDDAGRATGFA